ncbi:hypothetical protein J7E78_02770 [Paenibacillus polymyxa]|uniref:hypothetical protein n=1 Tax=Paenibacillus polymyxa TaxID=1406 RepID=UPI001BEB4D80|nr:hypothetical protein [Paenibacillus polymyxa]MBT2282475.1 hypothetical protein [Paenibacillus polymyxa]
MRNAACTLHIQSNTIFSSDNAEYGKLLAVKLVASEDAVALWDGLSKEEKEAVREFAQNGASEVEKFTQARVSDSTLKQNISQMPEDQALDVLINLIHVGYNVTTDSPITPLAVSTYTGTQTYEVTNLFGVTLYTFKHSITFRSDGSKVVSPAPSRTITPSVKTVGWSYEGVTTDEQRGGVGSNFYESNVIGHFKFSVVYEVQSKYPRIWLKGWSNGVLDYSVSD